ncbi:hypothetical protein DLNHIDIE_01873 [Acidithiobacillus thiooxidans ATCC 19377]|uniref:Uncharacterized protein n=1 Tax=Acidithiobacillus thiooxidans ATCC 19377 TaxID=637390 RepID=A0A543Q6P8_ACITH|nr:hypothetical protein DLNHIDIE_01873 [Acidithiobacillus thiooxidans ATCC 19377]
MGIVFWQWMCTLLVALVGYPIAYIAIRSAIQEKRGRNVHSKEHSA